LSSTALDHRRADAYAQRYAPPRMNLRTLSSTMMSLGRNGRVR
jgi:hypothetical protein